MDVRVRGFHFEEFSPPSRREKVPSRDVLEKEKTDHEAKETWAVAETGVMHDAIMTEEEKVAGETTKEMELVERLTDEDVFAKVDKKIGLGLKGCASLPRSL